MGEPRMHFDFSRSIRLRSRAWRAAARISRAADRMTDDQPEPGGVRLFDRMLDAGVSARRIEMHPAAGRVRVDGERVTDPNRSAAKPAVIVIALD